MERVIEQRRIARVLFTKCAIKLDNTLADGNRTKAAVNAAYENLKSKFDSLSSLENTILNHWLDLPERDEESYGTLIESGEEFVQKWHLLRQKYNEFVKLEDDDTTHEKYEASSSIVSSKTDRCKTLPPLELPKFNGDPRNWLYFWSKFKKVHEDNDMEDDVKLRYLYKCMEPESPAQKLFHRFPPTAENYSRAVKEMLTCFGREELLIEAYVEELLEVVLDQSKTRTKISIPELYNRLNIALVALESLCVTSDKYAAMLRPLVRSALPSELLNIWNKNQDTKNDEVESNYLKDLLIFLKAQAENVDRKKSTKGKKISQKENTKKCIFCKQSSHLSSDCEAARKMSEQEQITCVHQNRACKICLCKGHWHKYCRNRKIQCSKCGGRHYTFMCFYDAAAESLYSDT